LVGDLSQLVSPYARDAGVRDGDVSNLSFQPVGQRELALLWQRPE
jgi:hypothetical protein